MTFVLYGLFFILGTIIGSFLNVVIYRLHTGRSLSGRSHCMSCGETLLWYELFPILSYLFLWGRCNVCSSYIPSRYLIVEVLTGLLYLVSWHFFSQDIFLLLIALALVSFFVVISVYDIRHTIIPDEMTLGVAVVALIFLAYQYIETRDAYLTATSIGAGAIALLFFWGLWSFSKGRWIGYGDVKLAFPLGILVGAAGVFSMIVLSFWIGALVSLSMLGLVSLIKRGKTNLHFLGAPLTMKSEVPFAPFLLAGFLLVYFAHADIFTITYTLFWRG
jgi:leader peptidase (prepilin peptidase)/N-methyltransferase